MCLVFIAFLVSHLSNWRVICAFFQWTDDKINSGARAKMLINAWVATAPCCSVASVRKRLQASGIERSRRSVQRLMTAEHWPAKHVICVEILVFLCQSYFVVLLQVKNQHLTAPNQRRRLSGAHRCWSALAKRRGRIPGLLMPICYHFRDFHFRVFLSTSS